MKHYSFFFSVFFLFLLFFFGSCSPEKKQEIRFPDTDAISVVSKNGDLRASVVFSNRQPNLGESFFFRIRLEFKNSIRDRFQFLPAEYFKPFHWIEAPRTTLKFSENAEYPWVRDFIYRPEALQPGQFELPKIRILFQNRETGKKDRILIQPEKPEAISRFDASGDVSIRPAQDVSAPVVFFPAVAGGILASIAFIMAILFRVYRKQEGEEEKAPPLNHWEQAMKDLKALETQPRQTEQDTEQFYVRLSSIFRSFIQNYLKQAAEHLTAEELVRSLLKNPDLSHSQKEALQEMVKLSEIVKFAKFQPNDSLNLESLSKVRDFVLVSKKETTDEV